ncbi:hypothetical protein D3C77_766230 [compost metagenome]
MPWAARRIRIDLVMQAAELLQYVDHAIAGDGLAVQSFEYVTIELTPFKPQQDIFKQRGVLPCLATVG